MEIEMSALPKTWILDIDGTIVKHNGYQMDGEDTLLDGVKDFLKQIRDDDMVVFVTSRKKEYKEQTEFFLRKNNIRFDYVIYEAPFGERIVVNDKKPSGLNMAYAINVERNCVCNNIIKINDKL